MKVAYVCADRGVPVFGTKGCSVHVQEVVRALIQRGAEVHLFAYKWGGPRPAGLESVEIHPLHHAPEDCAGGGESMALSVNLSLSQALNDRGPFDLVYERYSLWSYAAMEYARVIGTTSVLEVNSPLIEEQTKYRKLENLELAQRVAERVFKDARILAAVSDGVADYLHTFERTRGRVHVVNNGVNPSRFPEELKPTYPRKQNSFTVGFIGTLKPWHGLSYLVEAFVFLHRMAPNAKLLIVGDGPERSNVLHHLAEHDLIGAARFSGAVSPDEVPGLLASMDVAVAPYAQQEQFYFSPLKVYEYMAAGLPVVASRIGQLATLIEDGTNGFLVPPSDSVALASALHKLSGNPMLCLRLGRAARSTVRRDHSWESIVEHVLGLAGLGNLHHTPKEVERMEIVVNGAA